jgi:hypothetical protein
VGRVGVGGLRGGGHDQQSGEDEEQQAVSHPLCNDAAQRPRAPS